MKRHLNLRRLVAAFAAAFILLGFWPPLDAVTEPFTSDWLQTKVEVEEQATVELPAEALTVSDADVSAIFERLNAGKRMLKTRGVPESRSSDYLGLEIAVDPVYLQDGALYRATVTLAEPVALAPENTVITAQTLSLYHIVKDEPLPVEDVSFDIRGSLLYGFTMTTDGFSPYMVTWTVNFHYQGIDYSIPGESQVLLSELIPILDIRTGEGELLDVALVEQVLFSDERLVTIEPVVGWISYNGHADVDVGEKDFLLSSLQAFSTEETLTLLLTSGEKVRVGVTDAEIENREDITEYYFFSNSTAMGYVLATDSNGVDKSSNSNIIAKAGGFGCPLNGNGNQPVYFAVPIANEGYRFVGWTNEGVPYTQYNAVSNTSYTHYDKAIRPNKNNNNHTTNMFVANFVAQNYGLIYLTTTEGGQIVDRSSGTGYTDSYGNTYAISGEVINQSWISAKADDGYRFVGWRDETGQIFSGDTELNLNNTEDIHRDMTVTAVFEKITEATIYYRVNPVKGTLSRDSEMAQLGGEALGSVATANSGYQFISWVDENGFTVSAMPEFVPTGSLIRDGAVYTALFEPQSYDSYLMVGPESPDYGYIISTDYENTVNTHLVTMYVQEDGAVPATITAVAREEYDFDRWELNGLTVSRVINGHAVPLGETIPAGFNVKQYLNEDYKWNTLIAYYEQKAEIPTHTIHYVVDSNQGTITNTVDTWLGSKTQDIHGSTATAKTGYEFKGWVEVLDDGNIRVVANGQTPTLMPSGENAKDATYKAVFWPKTQGWVGYNMNLTDTVVHWDGIKDWYISSDAGAPMYYSSTPYTYFNQPFEIDRHIPTAEGYVFVGWFDKDRPAAENEKKVNGFYSIAPKIYTPNEVSNGKTLYYKFGGSSGARYTLEALWAGIEAKNLIVPYDGASHTITSSKKIETGTVMNTPRYAVEVEKLIGEGKFYITDTSYQMLDENGNPVGDSYTGDSFSRIQPGKYPIRWTAHAMVNGDSVTLTKDAFLIIYPAKVIINKIWVDWYNETGVRPQSNKAEGEFTVYLNQGDNQHVTAQTAAGRATETEPQWEIMAADKWTETYYDVLVRPGTGYGENDQTSYYYPYTAEEVVPEHYYKVSEERIVSTDRLTTEITFVNRIKKWPVRFIKKNALNETINGAEFRITMIKNADGNTPNKDLTWTITVGEETLELYEGIYLLEETVTPAGYVTMEPTYFKVTDGQVTVTDGNAITTGGHVVLTEQEGNADQNPLISIVDQNAQSDFTVINAPPDVSCPVEGSKKMKGRELLPTDHFSFVMVPAKNTAEQYPGLEEGNLLTATNNSEGIFAFSLQYSYSDYLKYKATSGLATFTYLLTEEAPETVDPETHIDPGTSILYSTQKYWVQIDIGLDDSGRLVIKEKRVYTQNPLAVPGSDTVVA